MDAEDSPLMCRARLQLAESDGNCVRLLLDGWPLLVIDLDAGQVAVNDLRSRTMFAQTIAFGPVDRDQVLQVGAVGDELYVLIGEAAAVFVIPEPAPASHAEVAVIESATGQLFWERNVRYRQVPARQAIPTHPGPGR